MGKNILMLVGDFVEDYEVMVPFQALYPACGPEVEAAGGKYVPKDWPEAHVDGNLVTAPAWPAHPAWLEASLKLL